MTISWSFIAHAENAEATLVSAARWPRCPTQGHLSLHFAFCIFLFSADQTYFGGERSNMLVLHLPTNRP